MLHYSIDNSIDTTDNIDTTVLTLLHYSIDTTVLTHIGTPYGQTDTRQTPDRHQTDNI